jgi:hypothetical protein
MLCIAGKLGHSTSGVGFGRSLISSPAVNKILRKAAALQSLQTGQLKREQIYRLWKCAVKDDDRLADALIQKIYDTMIVFDAKRAETVIRLNCRSPSSG